MSVRLPKCLRDRRVIIVDVETTGFKASADRVIEVGLLWIESGEEVMGLSKLCNPGLDLPADIVKLTGITQEEVNEASPFSVIADFLIDTLESPSVVIAYNSRFDFGFLRAEVSRCGKKLNISDLVIDPLPWVRSEDKGMKCGLSVAAQRRGVKVKDAHRALSDCHMTVGVLNTVRMPSSLDEALDYQFSLGSGFNKRSIRW